MNEAGHPHAALAILCRDLAGVKVALYPGEISANPREITGNSRNVAMCFANPA